MSAVVTTSRDRQVSGLVMQALVSYVTRAAGADVADGIARQSGWDDATALREGDRWFSVDETLRVAAAASVATADTAIGRRVGEEQVILLCEAGFRDYVLAQEAVPDAIESVVRLGSRMSNGRAFTIVERSDDRIVIESRTTRGGLIDRFWCDYTAGVFASIPPVFGHVARVTESECQAWGGRRCRFVLSWLPDPRVAPAVTDADASRARVEERLGTFEYVHAMASDLLAAHDLEGVLDRMCEHAARTLEAPRLLIAVRTSASERLLVHHRGFHDDAVAVSRAHRLVVGDRDFVGEAALVHDIGGDRETHGLIAAFGPAGVAFTTWEVRTLGAYARHAAAALEIVAALDGAQRDRDVAHGLLELTAELAHAATLDDVATSLVRGVPSIVHADIATLWSWHGDGDEFRFESCFGVDGAPWSGPSTVGAGDFGFDLVSTLVAAPRPVVLTVDEVGDLRSLFGRERVNVAAMVPIVARGELLGVLTAGYRRELDVEDVAEMMPALQGLAAQGTTALVNVRLLQAARHQASHDALTGLPNRSMVETTADTLSDYAVLFIDLDEFKAINDSLGHGAGDELLRLAARRLAAVMRPGDTLGRLGGDEFVVLVPSVDAATAAGIGERIVAVLREPFAVHGFVVRISCSVGVTLACADDYSTVLAAADAAMYDAKGAGRNRVAVR